MFGKKILLTADEVLQDEKMKALIQKAKLSIAEKTFFTCLAKDKYKHLHYAEEKEVILPHREVFTSEKYYNHPQKNLELFLSFDYYKLLSKDEDHMKNHETCMDGLVIKSRKRSNGNITSFFVYTKNTGDDVTLQIKRHLGSQKGVDITVRDFINDFSEMLQESVQKSLTQMV